MSIQATFKSEIKQDFEKDAVIWLSILTFKKMFAL